MAELEVRPLTIDTWPAFAALAERHNGVWGGCWCIYFHPDGPERGQGAEANRALKECYVRDGRAHAALVFDGDRAVAWAEYGTPEELPTIYHRKEYDAWLAASPDIGPADYRITCLFTDRDYRRKGVSTLAVQGVLDLVAATGGGVVEAYPEDNQGKRKSASHLYNGTRSLFEQAGFTYLRHKGIKNCVMRRTVEPAT